MTRTVQPGMEAKPGEHQGEPLATTNTTIATNDNDYNANDDINTNDNNNSMNNNTNNDTT